MAARIRCPSMRAVVGSRHKSGCLIWDQRDETALRQQAATGQLVLDLIEPETVRDQASFSGDGEKAPFAGHALQLVSAALLEFES
jgi:hypothetical protein